MSEMHVNNYNMRQTENIYLIQEKKRWALTGLGNFTEEEKEGLSSVFKKAEGPRQAEMGVARKAFSTGDR